MVDHRMTWKRQPGAHLGGKHDYGTGKGVPIIIARLVVLLFRDVLMF